MTHPRLSQDPYVELAVRSFRGEKRSHYPKAQEIFKQIPVAHEEEGVISNQEHLATELIQ